MESVYVEECGKLRLVTWFCYSNTFKQFVIYGAGFLGFSAQRDLTCRLGSAETLRPDRLTSGHV